MTRIGAPGTALPEPEESDRTTLAWRELERSFTYFDRAARGNRAVYMLLRTIVLVAGAMVPILALSVESAVVVAIVGGVIVVAEGVTQLTQVHGHWLRFRVAAESLRREALAFVSRTGPYQVGDLSRDQLLASRLSDVATAESSAWEETVRAGLAQTESPQTAT